MRTARCLGGPLDGKVKPARGHTYICAVMSHERGFMLWLTYVKYRLARDQAGELLWLCDES